MKQLKAIVIGAGPRCTIAYTSYALQNPSEIKIVGVAEPSDERRNALKQLHNISEEYCFRSWEDILDLPKFADVAIIATHDQLHFAPAIQALDLGYHLLLEKPISPSAKECIQIREKANEKNLHVVVCHVLRYTNLFKTLKEIVDSGRIGKLMSITHCENVHHIRYAHSFVRGNWNNSTKSAPMILAKSCHDLDLIHWLCNDECIEVSSFGDLSYFSPDHAPNGATNYCLDGCPHLHTCTYSAPRIYVKDKLHETDCFTPHPQNSEEALEYLKTSNYGQCVFKCNNNVVDHQVVNLHYKSGLTVSFTMSGFTQNASRTMRLMGTHGEARIVFGDECSIELYDFNSGRKDIISPPQTTLKHGGGDYNLMNDFIRLISAGNTSPSIPPISASVEGHLLAFAAEASRVKHQTIQMKDFCKEFVNN